MKFLLLWTFVTLLCITTQAQTLSPVVISSSGGFYTAGGNTLSVTVAEMTMVQTFTQPSNILTQGFQQPEQLTTSVAEVEAMQGEVVVYPNPSNGQFNISYNALNDGDYLVKIYNMVGQIVFNQTYGGNFGSNIISLNIGQFGQGIYMLELRSTDLNGKQKSSIHKINLVY
ncbi:MAG: T9SS type A sorting domain-containing protein [Bacteroidota bacterium]